jgi:hypothetical protein
MFDGVPQLRHERLHAARNVVPLGLGVLQHLPQVGAPLRVGLPPQGEATR